MSKIDDLMEIGWVNVKPSDMTTASREKYAKLTEAFGLVKALREDFEATFAVEYLNGMTLPKGITLAFSHRRGLGVLVAPAGSNPNKRAAKPNDKLAKVRALVSGK